MLKGHINMGRNLLRILRIGNPLKKEQKSELTKFLSYIAGDEYYKGAKLHINMGNKYVYFDSGVFYHKINKGGLENIVGSKTIRGSNGNFGAFPYSRANPVEDVDMGGNIEHIIFTTKSSPSLDIINALTGLQWKDNLELGHVIGFDKKGNVLLNGFSDEEYKKAKAIINAFAKAEA